MRVTALARVGAGAADSLATDAPTRIAGCRRLAVPAAHAQLVPRRLASTPARRLASTSARAFNADAEAEAQIARGTTALQEGDLPAAIAAFERSLQIKPTASGAFASVWPELIVAAYFNLGVQSPPWAS